jgi:hypothetical protein
MKLRRLWAPCALVAAGVLLAGCGAAIPTDASVKSFCKTTGTFSTATQFSDGVKAAKKLHDTGTPKGISGSARDGFELVVALVTDAKGQTDLEKRYNKLTDKQKKSVAALDAYITKTC